MKKQTFSKQQRKSIVQLAVIWGLLENYYPQPEMQKVILDLMNDYLYAHQPNGERKIYIYDKIMIDNCIEAVERYGGKEDIQPTPEQILAIADIIAQEHTTYVKNNYTLQKWSSLEAKVLLDPKFTRMKLRECIIADNIWNLIEVEADKSYSDYRRNDNMKTKKLVLVN